MLVDEIWMSYFRMLPPNVDWSERKVNAVDVVPVFVL